MNSQTIIANCDQVIVTDVGTPAPRTNNYPLIAVFRGQTDRYCNWLVYGNPGPSQNYVVLTRFFTLYQIIDNNQYYVETKYGGTTATFSNLPVGEYIVEIGDPLEDDNVCTNNPIFYPKTNVRGPFPVYNEVRQLIGYTAKPPNGFFNDLFGSFLRRATNRVIVGQTRLVDNTWRFIETIGHSITPFPERGPFYSETDIVKIDATASKNYNRYFIAIQELYPDGVTQGRWRSLNRQDVGTWTDGQIGVFNLSDAWTAGTGWTFLEGFSYRVQVAIHNKDCSSWTEQSKTFRVCFNPSWGCRIGGEKLGKENITLSPNPTSNKFQLNGVDFSDGKSYKVSIFDVLGKEIHTFNNIASNEFAVNNFQNGVYIVNLTADNQRLFSSKLVVSK